MKLSITYKHVVSHKSVETEVDRNLEKLEKLLKHYSPDLIQLHAVFDENGRTKEYSCAVTLYLPGGNLHATGFGDTHRTCVKRTFSELESQIKKHQAKLRKDYEWKRKRPRVRIEAEAVS